MIPRIKSIKPLQGYLLHVIFDDGKDCIYVNDDINTIRGYDDLKIIMQQLKAEISELEHWETLMKVQIDKDVLK